ncbi:MULTISPECIES: restriction endonuclease subunit S [Staphylococcus]|uniref:restriction endonuclease subunit S n=1 Tax=Staphylococcus TaxID=1279 RepID=UPI001952546A|nr:MULTISPECIES: restriction endonuclease subunit S [Staphylococcus]MDU9350496.1 restriction endonuclease subunit S [Staphylococcus ureilyticus]
MEFKKYKIKDIGEVVTGFTPSKKEKDLYGFTFPFITPSDITNSKYVNPKRFLSEKAISKKEKKVCSKSSVGVSCIGSDLGKAFFIQKISFTNQQINTITNIKKNFDPEYIYYKIKTLRNYFHRIADGSTMPIINKSKFENLSLDIPSLKNQKKISNILSVLDNKIEINKKIIANLEEFSQTLFKRWFVDFEFPDENGNPYKSSGGEMVDSELGEIPKGWNVKNLDDIANYVNGLAMQKFKPTDNQNSLPVVKIKELKNGSTDENSNRCTSEIPDKALINDGDIIFSWSATLLVKMWCGGKAGLNQHLFKVSSDKYPKWFYYYWTKRYIDYFIGIANDKATTMGHINRKHLSHAKILIPNDSTLEKFSRTFDDLLEKELSVSKESKRLIELRDTLLPKLMSGEIEIPDDIEVNEDELSI